MVDVAVPTIAPLSALRRVELSHTGQWAIGSGLWNAARDDFVAAVAALDCPAVRRPVLKLGHSKGEEPLWAGNPTGTPAVGWVDNLGLTNQGHTLVGDFVGMPGWLGGVAASAYPDRSVEGTYDFRCQIGHTHPFVVTAVALLGVTRPGVGTLKSLQDVGTLYGVTASDDSGTRVEARFDPDQPRDDDGKWTNVPGGGGVDAALDALGIADRIPLRDGEQLVASRRVAPRAGDGEVALALTRRGNGWELRLGIVPHGAADPKARGGWAGANLGGTTRLDAAGAASLRQALEEAAAAGERFRADFLAGVDTDMDSDGVLARGVIPGAAWGDLEWAVYDTGGGDGLWALTLSVRGDGSAPARPGFELPDAEFTSAAQVRRMARALDELRQPMSADVVAHMRGRHDQSSHGRRYGPDGSLLRRLTRGGRRNAVRVLNRVLREIGGDEAATRPGMSGGPLTDLVRGIRDGVDGGQFTPDQALLLLSSLVFRPDVASNPRLSITLSRATGRMQGVQAAAGWNPADHPRNPEDGQFVDKRLSWDAIFGSYGEVYDEVSFGDDGAAVIFTNGDTAIIVGDDEAGYEILADGIEADTAHELADQLEWAANADDDSEPSANGLVDWTVVGDTFLVGYDPAGDVRFGYVNDAGDDIEDGTDLGAATAEGLAEALREMVERLADLEDESELADQVSASARMVQVAAAADVQSGAMVVLIPSDEDLQRLAVDGGEPVEQLHTTLMFLGEADAYTPQVREQIVAELRDVAAVIPPGEVDGFATSVFNPTNPDRETAIVLLLSGDGLEDVHGLVEAAVEEVTADAGLILPEQHSPWQPHVTLRYSTDLTQVVKLVDRTGPVTFDRLRVAFAGENIDIPLSGEGNGDPELDDVTDDDMPVNEVVAQQSRRFTRSDRALRRYWSPAGKGGLRVRWSTPGDWTRCVRLLRRHVRDPKGLCAVYHREFTGVYPGDRRNVGRVKAAFDSDQPRDPSNGQWVDVMHLATSDEIGSFRQRFGKAIPPAWTDVHLADDLDNAPLLVIGRDAKGRRQAIYSSAHTEGQAAKKFQRVQELNQHLDKLDHAVERDAPSNDDAAALLLIRRLGMRPGSSRDTQASTQAFGATTLQARHVTVEDGRAVLDFTGKKGVDIRLETRDPTIVEVLSRRLATRSGDARLFNTTEAKTRDYLHSTGVPGEFLLKDLRTVHANVIALREVAAGSAPKTKREFQQARRAVATAVSKELGNTPTLALSSYISPTVFGSWVADPSWVAAAAEDAGSDPVTTRAEEKRLLAAWFATVTFEPPETGIPAVEPDPDDEDDDGRTVNASEEATLPNPNPTIVHAAAAISVDDVRTAYYRQAPQRAWIREFHTSPKRLIVANDGDGTVARVDFEVGDDGAIRFGAPVPVRVEYVEQEAEAEKVAASRMVYASAAESRPAIVTAPPLPPGFQPQDVVAHLPGRHPQSTHGNRYGPDGKLIRRTVPGRLRSRASKADTAIRNAYGALARGEGTSIDAGELDGLLKALTGGGDEGKSANLAHLDVGGYGALFATDKTDALDRSRMPQLGTTEREMRPFLDLLRDRNVPVRVAEIDPTTLRPSQTEISGAKTGKLYGAMAENGWLPGGLLVTSGDGYVVDGHHRWSGAAAVRASGARPDMTVTGLVVDAPIDEVLQLAASVASFESLEFDRTGVQAAAVSDRPWSDFTEADFTVEQLRRSALIVRGDGSAKEQMSLPVREPDGTLNRNAVHAAAGGHGIGAVKGISDELRRATARKLVALYRQVGDEPPESLLELAGMSMSASADPQPETPAAEPDNPSTKEDDMPLSTEVYQRLGLAEDADETAVLAAIDEIKAKSEQAPDPQQVAAAAAEKDELTKEVGLLKGQVEAMSAKLSAAEEEKAKTVKASVLDTAAKDGKFAPADREKWEADYDVAPAVVTRVLASIASGTAVPVSPLGKVGDPMDVAASEDNLPPEPDWLDGPNINEPAMAGKE